MLQIVLYQAAEELGEAGVSPSEGDGDTQEVRRTKRQADTAEAERGDNGALPAGELQPDGRLSADAHPAPDPLLAV